VGITREHGGTSAPVQQEEEFGAAEVKFWKSVTRRTLGDRNDREIRKKTKYIQFKLNCSEL